MNVLPGRIKTPIAQTLGSLSTTTKTVFAVFAIFMIVSAFTLLKRVNDHFLVEVPANEGSISEGLIGTPRLINPVLAQNDAGKDIGSFVYAGLLRKSGSEYINELGQDYTVSADGLTYTFTLKDDLFFHDGEPLTSADIAFTVRTIQNPQFKSPKRAHFDQVHVDTPDVKTIVFTLPKPSNVFLADMTVGILPEHLWSAVTPEEFMVIEYNSEPVGAGPYMISSVNRGKGGLPLAYTLVPFGKYVNGKPLIKKIHFKVYQNDADALTALRNGEISSLGGMLPQDAADLADDGYRVETHSLPRTFGLFFNQDENPVLANTVVRKVLFGTAPRQEIIDNVFKGFALPVQSPFIAGDIATSTLLTNESAAALLEKDGWKMNANGVRVKGTQELAFSIETSNAEDLKDTAEILKTTWQELGFKVTVNIYESGELNQTVIRERKYEALLFGEVITQESDYNAFWNSSQRKDPGLNVAMYLNLKVDSLLNDLKNSTSTDNSSIFKALNQEFVKDMPAVMLYSPVYVHVVPANLSGYYQGPLIDASERFMNSQKWYTGTELVWPIFAKKHLNQ